MGEGRLLSSNISLDDFTEEVTRRDSTNSYRKYIVMKIDWSKICALTENRHRPPQRHDPNQAPPPRREPEPANEVSTSTEVRYPLYYLSCKVVLLILPSCEGTRCNNQQKLMAAKS